ncbi:methylated-DNA--[protein]-cysteine S-methyltransferase [Pseudonocardia bannensis]|uniref:Methylated-DNA--[protein]-cysteine S-methyltransferase n=1 Tax=Pseudonocardia bannensis TaxID=630973 RepID=A0A848DQ77_9PSEU|nr:methylated-DNA--[protein]-cysteine S-methyltransferase [Pseudonocardia bannensis]NMH94464.1 methylated-DNA--[protein]-cysteine S-methyltransferase [Pseudonocardia bannensis]
MMIDGVEPIVAALGGLAAPAPAGLTGKVFTGWLAAPSRLGEVFVAFTGDGVQFVRPAESVHGDADAFAEAYRDRFGRPLRPADRAPAGLLPALRGRPAPSLRLDLRRLPDFERDVLGATRRIPAGQTRPYGWIAREAGRPRAVRAVGSVLARNPVPLLVPCHRVVRADGRLGDYMFGPAHKEELLRAENVDLDQVAAFAQQGVHYLGSDTTGVVCFPTCHNARRISPAHRHGFRTIGIAVAAGYRPCRHCRPGVEAASA